MSRERPPIIDENVPAGRERAPHAAHLRGGGAVTESSPRRRGQGALERIACIVNLVPMGRFTAGTRRWMARHRYFSLSLVLILAVALGLLLVGTPSSLGELPDRTERTSWLTLFGLLRQLCMVTLAVVLLGWRYDWLAKGMRLVGIERRDIERLRELRFWYLGGYLLLEGFLLW